MNDYPIEKLKELYEKCPAIFKDLSHCPALIENSKEVLRLTSTHEQI